MKHLAITVLVLLLAIAFVGAIFAQAPKASANDPSLGTWVLNAQQSNLGGGPVPKAFVERYNLRPDGLIVSTRSIVKKRRQSVIPAGGLQIRWQGL